MMFHFISDGYGVMAILILSITFGLGLLIGFIEGSKFLEDIHRLPSPPSPPLPPACGSSKMSWNDYLTFTKLNSAGLSLSEKMCDWADNYRDTEAARENIKDELRRMRLTEDGEEIE